MTLAVHEPKLGGAERRVAMSEAEYFELAEPRVEYVEGEALFLSPVSVPHARLQVWLVSYADRLVRKHGGEVFPDSMSVRLTPDRSRVPDLTYVAPGCKAIVRENHVDGVPDLIVEVVSAESRDRDYREKFADYESAGVREYWIIDPTYQTIDLHRLTDAKYAKSDPAPDGTLTSAVLPGFTLKAEWLKQNPLPDPATLG